MAMIVPLLCFSKAVHHVGDWMPQGRYSCAQSVCRANQCAWVHLGESERIIPSTRDLSSLYSSRVRAELRELQGSIRGDSCIRGDLSLWILGTRI